MTRLRPILRLTTAAALFASPAAAEELKNYLLMPVTTDFQRSELGPGVTAFVAINGSALVPGGIVDPAALDFPEFRQQLGQLAKDRPGNLAIGIYSAARQSERDAVDFAEAALVQLGRRAGFAAVRSSHTTSPQLWQWPDQVRSLAAGGPDGEERPLADERVRVYPIRTRLSRWLTSNADAIAIVRRPLDGTSPGLPDGTLDSLRKLLGELQLPGRQRLLLHVSSTKGGAIAAEGLTEGGGKQIAAALGFASSSIRHSPSNGAPESLLGKPAPDFALKDLDGKEVKLRDATRGKVALVVFWGVACGPSCQQQAVQLSALYQRHRDAGFTVLAVNAYDEPPDKVARFVEQEKLTHPILLLGRQVAREKYAVGALPTAFWIDRQGKVVDYVVDFEPGDETYLAKTLLKLLAERSLP